MYNHKMYYPNSDDKFTAGELLPCPFCGGEAKLTFIGNDHTKTRKVIIKCTKCFVKRTDATIKNNHEWCAKTSINKWNTRQ